MGMNTLVTVVTERGQVSIPASIRKHLNLASGRRVTWESVSHNACRMTVVSESRAPGAAAMLGYANKFRRARRTSQWMADIRRGEAE